MEYDLRNRLWAHLLRQPAGYFDRWPTGQLMSRAMSDVQNVRMFLGYGLIYFTTNAVMMVAVVVLLFLLDWKLALLSMAFLPALLVVTLRFSCRLRPSCRTCSRRSRTSRRPPRRTWWARVSSASSPARTTSS